MHDGFKATLTTGEEYTGIQQYAGIGIVRWCAMCGVHKPQLGGTMRHVFGVRNWVCAKHPKVGGKNA